jgi:membrane protease YdiL (CAAX protease family)
METEPSDRRRLMLVGIAVEGGLGGLGLLLGWLLDQPTWAAIRWNGRDAAWGVTACVPMLALFLLCVYWPVGPLRGIKRLTDEILRPLFAECSVLDLAVLSLLAGFGEELLFRGALQGALSRWWGPATGLVAASAVFGLLHWLSAAYALLVMLMGLYLGGWWLATDNLLVVIVAHGMYDFFALVYLVWGPWPGEPGA